MDMFKQFYWNVYSGKFFGLLALVVVLTTVCSPLKAGNKVKVEDQVALNLNLDLNLFLSRNS